MTPLSAAHLLQAANRTKRAWKVVKSPKTRVGREDFKWFSGDFEQPGRSRASIAHVTNASGKKNASGRKASNATRIAQRQGVKGRQRGRERSNFLTLGAGRQCCLQSISSKTCCCCCCWLLVVLLLPLIIPNTTALVALRTVCRVAEEYTPSLNLPQRRARFSTPGRSRGTRLPEAGSLGLSSSTPLRSKS